ncbi:MAG TPA: hypothetical protein VHF24_01620 [Acidimicrobiales bacterium]|nr:hypothetical protein [Acidimicrobiales bacterium]
MKRPVPLILLAVLPLMVGCVFESQTLESGREQIRAMRKDPVLNYRVPGTTLRNQEEHAAAEEPFGGGVSPSFIRQRFEMPAEPGDAVAAYRAAAERSGWAFVADGCSRVERATAVVLAKRYEEFGATLVVRAQLDRDERFRAEYPALAPRGLEVSVEAGEPGLYALPVDAGLHRNDVQCLRGVDLSAPELQAPGPPSLSIGELCARIPLGQAKALAPEIEGAQLEPLPEECWLADASGYPIFIVKHARQPLAYYQDRRLEAPGPSDAFVFSAGGKKDPDFGRSVWVAAPGGPLTVALGGMRVRSGETDDRLLLAAARLAAAS